MSGAIRGPNNRFWIIKPTIMEALKNAKIEELGEKTDRDLRTKASIVYSNGPVGASEE